MGASRTKGDAKLRTQRLQIVVTASELGNRKRTITNLAFAPCASGIRSYTRLTIPMGAKKAGALSTTFDANFAARASRVLDRSNVRWINAAGRWNNVGLNAPYNYDPALGDLLINITARNADFTGSDPAMRADTRQGLHAFGFSPTPRTGALTMMSTKLRLAEGAAFLDLLTPGCGPGPLRLSAGGNPALGGRVEFQITGGRKTATPSIGVTLFGFQRINVGFGQDCAINVNPAIIFWSPLTGGVSPRMPFPIPNDSSLIGGKVYFQGAQQDPWQTRVGYVLSDMAGLTLGR